MYICEKEEEIVYWAIGYLGIFLASFWVIMPALSPYYRTWNTGDKAYWCSSIISTVNAIYIVKLGIDIGFNEGVGFFVNTLPLTWSSPASMYMGRSLCGYLLGDLVVTLYYNKLCKGYEMILVHHIAGLYCFLSIMSYDLGHSMMLSSSLLEVTNPVTNLRFMLDKMGYKVSHPRLYFLVGLTMTVMYFVVRICFYTYAGILFFLTERHILHEQDMAFCCMVYIGYTTGVTLQYVWFQMIVKGLYKLLTKKAPKKED